jgi:DNA repair photolyase
MITTKSTIDLIEVMQNDVIRVRVKTSVLSNDKQIAESFEHRVIAPGADYSAEDAKVKAIAASIHTTEVIAAYQAAQIPA